MRLIAVLGFALRSDIPIVGAVGDAAVAVVFPAVVVAAGFVVVEGLAL
jgi:hypothetical protein